MSPYDISHIQMLINNKTITALRTAAARATLRQVRAVRNTTD